MTLENLTVAVRSESIEKVHEKDEAPAGAVVLAGDACFVTLRRIRIEGATGDGLRLRRGRYVQVSVENLQIHSSGGNGVNYAGAATSRGVFFADVDVSEFGRRTPKAVGLRLSGPVLISQVSVGPVLAGQVGIDLRDGSDGTVIGSYSLFVGEGRPVRRARAALDIALGVGTVTTPSKR